MGEGLRAGGGGWGRGGGGAAVGGAVGSSGNEERVPVSLAPRYTAASEIDGARIRRAVIDPGALDAGWPPINSAERVIDGPEAQSLHRANERRDATAIQNRGGAATRWPPVNALLRAR